MRKNKLLALSLAAAMAVGTAGCSTPTTTVDDKKPEAESAEWSRFPGNSGRHVPKLFQQETRNSRNPFG